MRAEGDATYGISGEEDANEVWANRAEKLVRRRGG